MSTVLDTAEVKLAYGTMEYACEQLTYWEESVYWWSEDVSRDKLPRSIPQLTKALERYNHWNAIVQADMPF